MSAGDILLERQMASRRTKIGIEDGDVSAVMDYIAGSALSTEIIAAKGQPYACKDRNCPSLGSTPQQRDAARIS